MNGRPLFRHIASIGVLAILFPAVSCAQRTPGQSALLDEPTNEANNATIPVLASACDPAQDCDFIEQWHATGTLPPDPPKDYYYNRVMQQFVGSRMPLQPLTESRRRMGGPGGPDTMQPLIDGNAQWALTPMWASSYGWDGARTLGVDPFDCDGCELPGAFPNEFNALTVQGIFEDDMWEEGKQAEQFAPQTVFMIGAAHAGVSSLDAGLEKTYPSVMEGYPTWPKYTVGAMSHALILKGGTYWDIFTAEGATNFGWVAIDTITEDAASTQTYCISGDPETCSSWRGLFASAVGAENDAFFGNRISSSGPDGKLQSGVDFRSITYKEGDVWSPTAAIATSMRGSQNSVGVDTVRLEQYELPLPYYNDYYKATTVNNPGFIYQAQGIYALIMGEVEKSFFNIAESTALRAGALFVEDLPRPDGATCPDQRCESRVNCHYHLKGEAVQVDRCTNVDEIVGSSVGIYMPDMQPNSGGGEPAFCPTCPNGECLSEEADGTPALNPERFASIITRGSVFFGDGHVSDGALEVTGYDTDVVHVRDVLHLVPRSTPPAFDPNLAPEDRTGLIYFDLTRGTLRVSVPVSNGGEDDWRDSPVAWMDVVLDHDAVRPSQDVVGTHPEHALRTADSEALRSAHDAARQLAEEGRSPYSRPGIEAVPLGAEDFQHDDGFLSVSFQLSGFAEETPKVFWRAVRRHHNRTTLPDPWQEIDASTALPDGLPPGFASVPAGMDVGSDFHGVVEIMAVDTRTGRTAGTSFFSTHGG